MDLKIVGQFIKQQRKAKGYTQIELADKIMVSEKTISKWECGNGFPDTSLILPLCKALDISANELLSGKKLTSEEYKEQAEIKLIEMSNQKIESDRRLLWAEIVIAVLGITFLLVLTTIASCVEMANWLRILLIVGGGLVALISFMIALRIEQIAGFYECKECHHKYVPTYKQVNFAMHMGRTRYMKCPKCGKKSWQKKVLK